MESKECGKCKKIKNIEDFSPTKQVIGNWAYNVRLSYCRECAKEYSKKRYYKKKAIKALRGDL